MHTWVLNNTGIQFIYTTYFETPVFSCFFHGLSCCVDFFYIKKVTHSYQVQSFVRQGVDFQVSNGPAAVPGVCGLATRDDQHCQLSAEFHGGFHSHGLPKIDVFFEGKSQRNSWMRTGGSPILGNAHLFLFAWSYLVLPTFATI